MADHDDKLTASEEALLESFFSAACADEAVAAEPSPELLARVLEDGYGVQDALAAVPAQAAPYPAPRRGIFAALLAAIGGAPGLAGLAAATVAGVWFGASPPEAVSNVTASLFAPASASEAVADDDLLGYDMAYADLLTDG
ncbi:dihydroorotate dehydrogenase [Vannielia litorea]|uniref:dihydroorotate dehydrogenase n=1 Tax=Vannielia litorea TaxID=1217970 RepID=UPI001BCC9DA8|nr:dihydroorotate dehydrogenase [Vannielia litorea]MBS8228746.1 dihydroorotate dehydrogenase [Vannielia litorea]